MIQQLLQRRIIPEKVWLLIAQAVVLACAVLIVGYAFIRMALLNLTEPQWLIGLAIVTALVLQCMILAALIDLKRKMLEPGSAANPASSHNL
jgi:protein-S-isoprenylcysteine O-methyltransferase Ste14